MGELTKNPRIAFACGTQFMQNGQQSAGAEEKSVGKLIKGYNDIRLYRREFIEGIGGYPVFNSPDTVLLIKALNRGWEVNRVEKTYFTKSRAQGSKIGFWNGYKLKGKGMYKLGYHPVLLFLSAVYFSKSYPFYQGIAALYGYVMAFARREEKIDDREVIQYFWRDRLAQVCKGKLMEG
jgi:hypothetical protein